MAVRPGRARSSPVNRPNAETARCIVELKYQKNAVSVKDLWRSEEE
jgi:hypothetical protein